MSKQIQGSLILLLAALIWGCAFVAQTVGMDYVGPLTFHSVRCLLGGLTMLLISLLRARGHWSLREKWPAIRAGALCGLPLCGAALSQQYALAYTTVSKAGFITAVYMLFVPLFCLVLGKRPGWKIWPCVGLALIGLYLLSMTESLSLSRGDSLALLCAALYAVQILCVDHFAPHADAVDLNGAQFLTSGLITLPLMLVFEAPTWRGLSSAWLSLAYAGVLSGGVAFCLQIVGQQRVKPSVASLFMSLESVFAALGGWLILGQSMSLREIGGSLLMFLAIVLAQLPDKKRAPASP